MKIYWMFFAVAALWPCAAMADKYYFVGSVGEGKYSSYIDVDSVVALPDGKKRAWLYTAFPKDNAADGVRLSASLELYDCQVGSEVALSLVSYNHDLKAITTVNGPMPASYPVPESVGAENLAVACDTTKLGSKAPISSLQGVMASANYARGIAKGELMPKDLDQ